LPRDHCRLATDLEERWMIALVALLGVRPARQLRSVLDSRKRFHRIGAAHNAVEFVRSQCLHES